jgi:HlyD family secretion protein
MGSKVQALLMVVVGTALLGGCGGTKDAGTAAATTDKSDRKPVVQVARPDLRSIVVFREFTGRTQASDIVPVGTQVPGEVMKIEVVEGQRVKKGDVLLRLDDQQQKLTLAQAENSLAQAEAQLGQLKIGLEIEQKNMEIVVERANAGLRQVQARARLVDNGARPEERKQAEAATEMAKAQVEALKRELGRLSKLAEDRVIPKQQVETLEDQYRVARAQYDQAKAGLTLVQTGARTEDREAMVAAVEEMELQVEAARTGLRKVEADQLQVKATEYAIEAGRQGVELARLALEKTVVPAPVNGLVDGLQVRVGMVVGAGIPLLNLVDDASLEVHTAVSDEDRAAMKVGLSVAFSTDALPGKQFGGKVTYLGSVFDPTAGGFPVHVSIDSGATEGLGTGMYVRGRINLGQRDKVLVLPLEAVLHREGKRVVYVHSAGKVRMQAVEMGQKDGAQVEILAGLKATDEVVVRGQISLVDGLAVLVDGAAPVAAPAAPAAKPAPAAPAAKPAPAAPAAKPAPAAPKAGR